MRRSFKIIANTIDSDQEGMPDRWEIQYQLNPKSLADCNCDRNNDGYINLKEYINYVY